MASFAEIRREEKRRIAAEVHDNLIARAAKGPPDALLDPFIARTAASRDALGEQVQGKAEANAQRAGKLAQADIDDDEVDRWYRHIYRYTEVESIRRHAPEHAAIDALLVAGYPNGLSCIDDRIPDQNDEVRKMLAAYSAPEHTSTIVAMKLPKEWIDFLFTAVAKSDASFSAYQATLSDASSAVALGRDEEAIWVQLMRALSHAIGLRAADAAPDVAEEGETPHCAADERRAELAKRSQSARDQKEEQAPRARRGLSAGRAALPRSKPRGQPTSKPSIAESTRWKNCA